MTDNNTVGFTTGLLANACDFNSSNSEYLSIIDADQIGLEPTSFTISAWAKQVSSKQLSVVGKYYTGNSGIYSYLMAFNADTTQHSYNGVTNGSSYDELTGSISLVVGTWYHLVFTYDGATKEMKSYINGTLGGSITGIHTLSYSTGNFAIGHGYSTNYFNGYIDEITFFDTALSSGDISTLYNSGTPLPYSAGGGDPEDPPATTTPTTTPSTSDNGDLVFMLSVIVFFLSTFWVGYIISMFRKSS